MLKTIAFAAMSLAIASPAVAAKFNMQLQTQSGQTARMMDGVAAVDSSTSGSSVRLVQAEGALKKRGTVSLLVMNQGGKPFNFGPENVTARLADGTDVKIITYEQLVREEKKRQTWAAIAAGLAAAGNSMNAANAGRSYGTATYSGSTFGSYGGRSFNSYSSGMGSYSSYNAGQAQMAQSLANAQNQANFSRMAEQNAANMNALKANMRTTTVDPDQMFGGSVMFELPKSVHKMKGDVPVTFIVTIEGESHTFNALLKQQ